MQSGDGLWGFLKSIVAVIVGIWIFNIVQPYLPMPKFDRAASALTNISEATPFGHDREVDQIAQKYGVTVDYNFDDIRQYCVSSDDDSDILASFCAANPDVIYVNKGASTWFDVKNSGGIDDVMLHELSHRAIYQQCQTTNPPVIERLGANSENTASSYAVRHMGADYNQLSRIGLDSSDNPYAMTGASDQAADAISSGVCQ